MKKKSVTFLLIAMVVLVWGVIIFKVVSAMNADDDTGNAFETVAKKSSFNDFAVPVDSGKLALNYPDPFFTSVRDEHIDTAAAKAIISHKPQHRTAAVVAPSMNWDNIRYLGFIRNAATHKIFAIIRIGSEQAIVAEGEQYSGLKLLKNYRDSVAIIYAGIRKNIKITKQGQ